MCLKFWKWLLPSQTKTPPGSFVTTNAIDFPPFRTPPPFLLFVSQLIHVYFIKACGPVELIAKVWQPQRGTSYSGEVCECVWLFCYPASRHWSPVLGEWQGSPGRTWPRQQGTNGMFLLPLKKGSQASVLPTEVQFPFCFEMLLALSERAVWQMCSMSGLFSFQTTYEFDCQRGAALMSQSSSDNCVLLFF